MSISPSKLDDGDRRESRKEENHGEEGGVDKNKSVGDCSQDGRNVASLIYWLNLVSFANFSYDV